MNAGLWNKSWREARLLLLGLTLLMFGFQWLFVWITSLLDMSAMLIFMQSLPKEFERMIGVMFKQVATPQGRIAMAYIDPLVILSVTAWGIARGSDCVSGELGRGTLEMLLAQPVRRLSLLVIQAIVTTCGAAVIALAAWLGTWTGLSTVELGQQLSPQEFVPGALNLFSLTFCLAGMTTLVSAMDTYRWRTIGIMGGFYAVSLIIKIVGRMAPDWGWLLNISFLTAFEPQTRILTPGEAWGMALRHDGLLFGLGLGSYVLAAIVFCRRDLPAPL